MKSTRAVEDRLRVIAGDNTRGLIIVSREGEIVFADAAAETFFQRKPGGLAGEMLVSVLAGGGSVEIALQSATGSGAALMRMSEIQWEGKPAYLATLRDSGAQGNGLQASPDSELHYREIVQSTPDLIFMDRAGLVSYVNEGGIKLLRAGNAREIVGRPALDFFHSSYHSIIRDRIAQLLQGPSVAPLIEEKLVALDGAVIDVEVRAVSFFSQGELAIQVICRDISARKAAERALLTSSDRFRQLAEAMPQIVWTSTPGGGLDYASPAFGEYTGMKDAGEAPGLRWMKAVHPDDVAGAAAAREAGQSGGVPYSMEFRVRRFDGAYRWHFVNAVPVRDEDGHIVKWFGSAVDVHDRKTSEQTANQLAMRLAATLESITDAFITLDRDWRVTYVNKEAERLLRTTRDQVLGKVVWDEFKGAAAFEKQYRRAIEENRMVEFEEPYTPLGLWVEVRAYPSEGGLAVYFRDVTERRELETRLRQAQRLQSIGQLTGGIAHDFNNLLTVIMGNSEVLIERLKGDPVLSRMAELTMAAAERGADLTGRLLAFARKQALEPKPVDVGTLLTGMNDLLRRTLGEHVQIELSHRPELWRAFVDGSQLESAVLNLCLNARDSMPKGGRLTIETANVTLDDTYAQRHEEVAPGDYVMVAVSDTGTGMAAEIVARAFEPFFTTKDVGKGTGLGLSMVHGFIKQSNGHVKIYTELGHGTTIKLYLPKAAAGADRAEPVEPGLLEGGSERILLVEDDDQVRDHVTAQLMGLGYRVHAVADAAAALNAMETNEFDLLFTDVIMPGGMNGPQLVKEAHRLRPKLRVLFTSGYTENAIVHQGRLDAGVQLLNKPYRRGDLAAKIRDALR